MCVCICRERELKEENKTHLKPLPERGLVPYMSKLSLPSPMMSHDMWPKIQLFYHANSCNHVLQVLPTTSLVYIVFPYSGPGIAQNRDNIIKHSIKSLQLLHHANPCNHVLQVLPTTSLVYMSHGSTWDILGQFVALLDITL